MNIHIHTSYAWSLNVIPADVSELIQAVKRVIIKVGTSVLTRDQEFGVSLTRLASLVEQVSALVHQGKEVIIVTSGAVGFGKMKLQVRTVTH